MPSSILFGINNEGRVHTLSTTGSFWRELPYGGQEFKKLSALPHFLWALGGDHQIYVYVHGLDIPIRVREESYENERWYPIEGFSSKLLPTDRHQYSDASGSTNRSMDTIRLPSMAWQWEGDWKLELSLEGQPLDHNGWTYAMDFPSQFHPKKQWTSCVRRRLWVRSRRYSAMNSWCAIAPLHKDATSEPFIDISIGGQSVPGAEEGTMLVWAITNLNRVMFRMGVSTKSPEGIRWNDVSVPLGCEICQISVGSTGLVWASLACGRALVRGGVTRDNLQGSNWIEVRNPAANLRIVQLSVGTNAIWALTHDKHVWFRKGVRGESAGVSEDCAIGSGWIEMVGTMTLLSVCANDQLFAIGADDRRVYFRTEVTQSDLTGKRWKTLTAPLQVSRASSNASLNRDKFHRSIQMLGRPSSMYEPASLRDYNEQSHSAPTAPTSLPLNDASTKFETQPKNPKAWSPIHSVGSVVGMEVHPETDESIWSECSRDSCIFGDDEELGWAEYEAPWSWVEAGACIIEHSQIPNWFTIANGSSIDELDQPWRNKILDALKYRLNDGDKYVDYEMAVDTSSWIQTGEARVSLKKSAYFECCLQLEWQENSGTLTILNPDGASTLASFSLSDISCIQNCSEPGNPRLTIQVPRLSPPEVKLQFASDNSLEEWQTHLHVTCSKIHNIVGKPNDSCVWSVTKLGDIFIWDPTELEKNQLREDEFYVQKYDLSGKESPIKVALRVGCNPGSVITLSGCFSEDAERIGINLDADSTYKIRSKAHVELENTVLHINPRFSDDFVVRNTMIDGKWGKEERDGVMPFARGQEFTLKIVTTEDAFILFVDNQKFCSYRHRLPPQSVSHLSIWGRIQPYRLVINSPQIIIDPYNVFWRQIGGHVRKVESCNIGVTWAIGYDQTAWVYTEGWGGGFLGTMESHNIHPMTDSQDYRVYENQRWNPVTGFASAGLPTDRPMWSDASGKQKRLKDQVKLQSKHWQWISDWMVDFHVPGGVDKDGWQYAVDFPASFHSNKNFTDYVRRRRWYRRCAVSTTGPWQELGHTKLLDVSLEPVRDDLDTVVSVWALASGGQPMIRVGVSKHNPMGNGWEHVSSEKPLSSISCGPFNKVWATEKKGCACVRVGITEDTLEGEKWIGVESPSGGALKQISVNTIGIWAVDNLGRLHVRINVSSSTPQGTHWQTITPDPPVLSSGTHTKCFKQVSVSRIGVWAVTDGGSMVRRLGICPNNPAGSGWDIFPSERWHYISIRAFN
ncbi:hypothetical protein WA026_008057 [Henosepilachna vigintioctopunctata]|uniref:Galectin domain-containing protein n=1 Tax=Henosepilachna vigintioctopunctata TaxID=420089 RepID=A0AAW1TRT0_9CUCU